MSSKIYGWLSTDPPVLIHSIDPEDMGVHLPEEPIIRFMMYMWHSTSDQIVEIHREAAALRPSHLLHHLVNDPTVCQELIARGISARFVNHNAFIDERRFVIKPNENKRFDAVYNARMNPFKRHHLASKISKLLLIGGVMAAGDNREYFEQQIAAMPHATFVHAHDNRMRTADEIVNLLSQARVGLCLSACEGAMYAATEYLLCGLPIVSTVSEGGRDAWFDPRFSRIVPDDPDAVAAAVSELAALKISPEFIRNETLNRMWDQRKTFFDLGQTIYSAQRVGREFARDFYANYTSKMGEWRKPNEVMQWFEERRRR